MAKRRQYGTGQVYQNGKFWHIRYCDGEGKRRAESSGSERRADAERLLRKRLAEEVPTKKADGFSLADCFQLLVKDYIMHERQELSIAKYRIGSHLQALAGIKAATFKEADAERYIEQRKKAGAAPSTINRELSLVRASLKLAKRQDPPWLSVVPTIPMLQETNVRIGFLSAVQIANIDERLPEYLRPLLCIASLTGLRRGSLLRIRLDQVDLADGLIHLYGEQVKNRIGHQVPIFDGAMRRWVEAALRSHKTFLFEHDGKPIRSFKNAWNAATASAGMPGLRFHDLRRTGVRNLIRAGVPEEIVMAISGHKTRSMLQRYNIINADDVRSVGSVFSAQLPQNCHTEKPS